MITITHTGDWARAAMILRTAPAKLRLAMDRAVLAEAHFFRRKVVEGFRTQAPGGQHFKPLSPLTLAIRRFRGINSTKALIVHGDLRNSISVFHRMNPLGAEAFVGVKRGARGRQGQDLVNIAEIHEFGAGPIIIPVTDAMRRFFFAMLRKEQPGGTEGTGGGGFRRGFLIVKIPARPFLRPVAEKWFDGPQAAIRFQRRVAANLGGILGAYGNIEVGGQTRSPGRDATGRFVSRSTDKGFL